MAKPNAPDEPLCIIEGRYLLPQSKALEMLNLVMMSRKVSYDWSIRGYKYDKSEEASREGFTIKVLSPTELAQLAMEEA